jgi:predicted DNA binding CopG/RHH family protein
LANADDLCSVTEELINVELEDEILESLASKAKENGVPLANFVKSLLEKAIKEQKN